MPAAAVAGIGLVGGIYSARQQSRAAQSAANVQSEASQAGIEEQRRQFDEIQKLLAPYVSQGTTAMGQQGVLAGLQGADQQRAAIEAISSSPELQALMQQGETGILQNASATGGLRGGNVQGALARFRPALLSAAINDQYSRLAGISDRGLNAATGTGQFGQASSNNVTQLLQQQGSALAGAQLARGQSANQIGASIGRAAGSWYGLGGPKQFDDWIWRQGM